jgi:epoxyqueuosine reductase QueG
LLYHRTNKDLNALANEISGLLGRHGIGNLAVPSTLGESEIDSEYGRTLRYSFSHKMAATRSGLGWIGKTGLLVTGRFGPRVRLATVLAENGIEAPGVPVTESRCGSCVVCVEKCPAKAANGRPWSAGMDRDEFYDAFRCRDMCRKLSSESLREEISICGICVSVCPWGKRTGQGRPGSIANEPRT